MHSLLSRQQWAAKALVNSGFSRWSRQRLRGQVAVLTFHGLRASGRRETGLLDQSLHEPVESFREICAHLASHYEVITLEETAAMAAGRFMARRGREDRPQVALTFDDGYRSNLRLALPVLREFGLPATVFVSSAFAEGELLWFQKVDLALLRAEGERLTLRLGPTLLDLPLRTLAEKEAALRVLLTELKRLPWSELQAGVEKMRSLLGVDLSPPWPEPVRPLSRDELQALAADGLVEIGGHTHRHPILAHCTDEAARAEIQQGADRLAEMLGRRARFFAYPNGGAGDFDALRCGPWLEEAGYEAAFSMINGPVQSGQSRWALPRYGAPLSVGEAEATVSGAFEVVRRWRRQFRRQAAL